MENRPQQNSLMARKFKAYYDARAGESEPEPTVVRKEFRKEHYFFYGSLMDPSTLMKVLRLRDQPKLVPAKITGFSCKLWGPYPALVDGPSGKVVYGMTYVVEKPSHQVLLEIYETNHYEHMRCRIELQDGREIHGRTFIWNADKDQLTEGVFDLEDWKKLGE